MMRIFRKLFLGGQSDKRESSWMIFLLVNAILIYAVWRESGGLEMPQTWAFLAVAWPASGAGVIGVHAQHFHAEAKAGRMEEQFESDEENALDRR